MTKRRQTHTLNIGDRVQLKGTEAIGSYQGVTHSGRVIVKWYLAANGRELKPPIILSERADEVVPTRAAPTP